MIGGGICFAANFLEQILNLKSTCRLTDLKSTCRQTGFKPQTK